MSVLTDDFGTKVRLPPWKRLDLGKVQLDTIAANQKALPEAAKLGDAYNTYTLDQLEKSYGLSRDTMKQIGANIGDWASGNVDVRSNLSRTAASNVGRGISGTPFGAGVSLKRADEEVTAMKQRGLDSAMRWMQAYKNTSFDITSMFRTPQQGYAETANERDLAFKHAYLKAQIEAAPDPATRGLMDAIRNGTMYASGGWNGTYQTPAVGQQGGVGGGGGGGGGGYFGQGDYNGWGGGGDTNWESQTGGNPIDSNTVDWNANFGSQFSGWG